jgi:hypothetical protein
MSQVSQIEISAQLGSSQIGSLIPSVKYLSGFLWALKLCIMIGTANLMSGLILTVSQEIREQRRRPEEIEQVLVEKGSVANV